MKKMKITFSILLMLASQIANAQDVPFIGEIKLFAGNYKTNGWLKCEGQILNIAQNVALFSIIGTTYGGNGTTNFALPDLRGRAPIGAGAQGPGLDQVALGQKSGVESNSLTVANLPAHTHSINVSTANGTSGDPSGNFFAFSGAVDKEYNSAHSNQTLNAASVSNTGAGTPLGNMQPSLVLTYWIAIQGIFPSQN
jgi:microcystin-dependent protein